MKKIALFYLLTTFALAHTPTADTHTSIQDQSPMPQDSVDSDSNNTQSTDKPESNTPHREFDNEGFITFKEYGKNLYENPRGIGCHHCHGTKGEGNIIAHYKHKGNAKTLSAPAINRLEFNAFAKSLDSQKIGVMPRYYLTPKEIQAIYFYLYEGDDSH